jgi:hypothetical protein
MKRFHSRFGTLFASVLFCLLVAACGTGRTMITAAPSSRAVAASLNIEEGNSTVMVPDEVKVALRKQLIDALHEKAQFPRGQDLTLRYRFVQYSPGDRFQRWFWGGVGN